MSDQKEVDDVGQIEQDSYVTIMTSFRVIRKLNESLFESMANSDEFCDDFKGLNGKLDKHINDLVKFTKENIELNVTEMLLNIRIIKLMDDITSSRLREASLGDTTLKSSYFKVMNSLIRQCDIFNLNL